MVDKKQKRPHLRSVVKRNKAGVIVGIAIEECEEPRFHTPAYDEFVVGNKIPRHLWKIVE